MDSTRMSNSLAWGQDAIYLGDEILPCNTTWTNDKPYIVYSSILVDTLCQLTIEKGTRIFGAKGCVYLCKRKYNQAEGTSEERIIFRNERLDARL